jgi:hypothetical protein
MMDELFTALVIGLVSFGLLLMVGLYSLIDYVFIDDEFEVSTPIKPQIKLVTDGKTVDTVYIYKFN